MRPSSPWLRPRTLLLVALAALVVALLGAPGCGRALVAARIRRDAAERGLAAGWRRLDLAFPARVSVRDLTLTRLSDGVPVFVAESLAVTLDPWRLLLLHRTPRAAYLAHARLVLGPAPGAAEDSLEPPPRELPARARVTAPAVRHRADALVRALLLPARQLPSLTLRDVTVEHPGEAGEPSRADLRLSLLELRPVADAVRLDAAGTVALEREAPFTVALRYDDDDRLTGLARIGVFDPATGLMRPLRIDLDGAVNQDRRDQMVRVADSTLVTVGGVPMHVAAVIDRHGPALDARLDATGITPRRIVEGLPRPLLGPLADLAVTGAFDYHARLDIDLAHPSDVELHAGVVPHGLAIDSARSRLDLAALARPFVATIHLPHGRLATRDLSPANPHFLPLESIDSTLVHAVLANEDGGFFQHRGFNTAAVRMAIAANLAAGAYRRGAGTITMQLARNLWLGHERTLARKAQEVVLTWMLEHLTGLTKQRLLEIYLNIIEWGPGVHGADEATRYYFDHGAEHVSVDEALFLTTLVPSPARWRGRLDREGVLRPWTRAQMHFIGRAMVAKGWLAPEALPPADSLRVTLDGPARAVLDSVRAASGGGPPRVTPRGSI